MSTKKCPNCQTEQPETAKFCAECGSKFEIEPAASAAMPELPERALTSPETPQPLMKAAEAVTSPISQAPAPQESEEVPPTPEISEEAEGPPGPAPGAYDTRSKFGERYKIIETLGSGRLGTVYRVYDKALERELALRSIKTELPLDEDLAIQAVTAFNQERRIIHKNISRIFELGAEQGNLYLTMEHSPGQELHRLMKQTGRLPFEKTIDLAKQISTGLAEAHRLGATHLDLMPGNIMVGKDGTARIMDLGIVRFLQAQNILGPEFATERPEYLSPEQVERKKADARSDVYSLGLILYELMTGRPAITANTPGEYKWKQVSEAPRDPRQLNPLIGEPLSRLILKCLEKDPEKRFQSAGEVLAELEQVAPSGAPEAAGEPVPAPQEKKAEKKEEVKERPEKIRKPALKRIDWGRLVSRPRRILIPALVVAAAAVLGILLWRFLLRPSGGVGPLPAAPQRPSVAVLPFVDLSPGRENELWGDGMTEALIGGLTKIGTIFVPGCGSSFFFKGKSAAGREAGLRLGVEHLLKAEFTKSESSLRIDAQLLKADGGSVVWSRQWERSPADVRTILEEISRQVLESLNANPPAAEAVSLFQEFPTSAEVFDLYAQGRSLLRTAGQNNLEKALEYFEKASLQDSRCPAVQAGLAETYITLGNSGLWASGKSFPKARIAALNGLEIRPDYAEAQTLMAIIKGSYDWDMADAEKRLREVLRIKPDHAPALRYYADLLSALGRHEEAVAKIKAARTQDPLSPVMNARVAAILYHARLYDQAIEEIKNALEADPLNGGAYYYLGLVLIQTGQYEQAAQSLRRADELGGDAIDIELRVAYARALQKRREDVGAALNEALRASGKRYVSSVALASVYAALFEKEQAFACLEKALSERDPHLLWLKVHPMLDFLRRDPQFVDLQAKIGLPK